MSEYLAQRSLVSFEYFSDEQQSTILVDLASTLMLPPDVLKSMGRVALPLRESSWDTYYNQDKGGCRFPFQTVLLKCVVSKQEDFFKDHNVQKINYKLTSLFLIQIILKVEILFSCVLFFFLSAM